MFGTSGVRGTVGDEITAELALSVGRALASEGYDRVVVGRDTRDSGRMLTDALTAGVRECGADVVDVGVAATPTVARSIERVDADAGVVVTASHNPAGDNGIKLWNDTGMAFDGQQRAAIADRVADRDFTLETEAGLGERSTDDDATAAHVAALVDAVDLEGTLSVAVDVGNGAGGVTATALRDLGCEVWTLNATPDGTFPARPSEPTAEACGKLASFVAATDVDLGVAHDGDADRMMAVDETGRFVPGDLMLALFARSVATPGSRVAAPLNTSLAVDDALDPLGATVEHTKVGDVFVAERAQEPDVIFGGEPSGAWIWPEETLCPDGALAACRLVEMVSREGPLSEQLAEVAEYPIRRTSVEVAGKSAVMDLVAESVRERYDDCDASDGIRVDVGDGWFLVRASGTEPLVRVTAEARDEARADELFERARSFVDDAVDAVEEPRPGV